MHTQPKYVVGVSYSALRLNSAQLNFTCLRRESQIVATPGHTQGPGNEIRTRGGRNNKNVRSAHTVGDPLDVPLAMLSGSTQNSYRHFRPNISIPPDNSLSWTPRYLSKPARQNGITDLAPCSCRICILAALVIVLSPRDPAERLQLWAMQGLRAVDKLPLGLGQTAASIVVTSDHPCHPGKVAAKVWQKSELRRALNGSLTRNYAVGVCLSAQNDTINF